MNKNNELKELLLLGINTIKDINFQQSMLIGSNPLSSKMAEEVREKAKQDKKVIHKLYTSFIAECLGDSDVMKVWALKNKAELKSFSNFFIKTYFDNILENEKTNS